MRKLELYITDFCNLKCRHCYMEDCERKQLSFSDIKDIIKKAEQDFFEDKIEAIDLLGGEPTIHPDFEKIVDYLHQNKYKIGISTNGYFIKKIKLETLKKINYIQLSCECLNKDVLDSYRGKGYYDNLIETTQYLKHNNILYGYKFLIAKDIIPHLEETICLAKKLGATKISGARFIPIGNGLKNQENDLTKEELEESYIKIFNAMIKNNIFVNISDGLWHSFLQQQFKQNLNFKGCAILNDVINVIANGDILLCRKIDLSFGNILSNPNAFQLIKEHPLYNQIKNRDFMGKCGKCKNKHICGGCRAYAFAKNGDILSHDLLCFL